mgnify:CR=1 FL=1
MKRRYNNLFPFRTKPPARTAVGWEHLMIRPDTKLTAADKRRVEKAIRRAKKEGKIAKTAQQTIPYEEMYPDGICRITNRLYSKSVLCDDINYAEASDDEKAVLFELYCKLVNYFGPSVGFELSVICYPADLVEYRKMLALNPQGDQFDEIRKEYSDMLVRQVSKSRYERRICLTYTIEADGIRQARSRLEQIDNDVVGHFRALTVAAHPMDGYERLTILHRCLHLEENRKFVKAYLEEHLPEIRLIEPEGTYLLWLDFKALHLNEKELEHLIVDKAHLWLDSGAMFGPDGEGFERINIACPRATVEKALKQLEAAIRG